MSIDFSEIFELNIPFVQAELVRGTDSSSTVFQEYTCLLIGQKTSSGTADTEVALDIFSESEAKAKFGKTSMLAHAVGRYFDNNSSVALKVIALDDEATGTAATGSIAITGTATENGTLAVYINGKSYATTVSTGATASEIGDLLVETISEDDTAQITASNTSGTVTFTAVHKGTYGNTLKIKLNYNTDDSTPNGLSATITDMAGGAGNPDLDTLGVITILEENQYNLIAMPYTDNATLTLVDDALTDNFKADEMLDGFCIVGVDDTVTNLSTKTETYETTPFISILDNYSCFASGFEHAAGYIGYVSGVAQSSPGSAFYNGTLEGFSPLDERLSSERNVLAGNGVTTFTVSGSDIKIERAVTTLQVDENEISLDMDYRDLRVFTTISYVRYAFIVGLSIYQGYKLGNDDDLFGQGVEVVTPNLYKQTAITIYSNLVTNAICEDLSNFEDTIIVEKDGNRINTSMTIDIINVALQQAMKITYTV